MKRADQIVEAVVIESNLVFVVDAIRAASHNDVIQDVERGLTYLRLDDNSYLRLDSCAHIAVVEKEEWEEAEERASNY